MRHQNFVTDKLIYIYKKMRSNIQYSIIMIPYVYLSYKDAIQE